MIEKTEIFKVTVTGGLLDDKVAWDYEDFDPNEYDTSTEPEEPQEPQDNNAKAGNDSSLAQTYLDKAAANYRFKKLAADLSRGLNTMTDVITTDGSAKVIPSEMSFTLIFTQPDGLWVEVDPSEYAEDEEIKRLRDGRVIFTGKKAIERMIENSLAYSYEKSNTHIVLMNYWDPTFQLNAGVPAGVRFGEVAIEAVDDATIEIERILPEEVSEEPSL